MPQPDNRRERGAATQTTQQQVAPQGQMTGPISPISGGAAAAAPVLQIGQQAQIKRSGAELYDALYGALKGASAGLENYDKMYKLVSEKDYADFETQYVLESDRVKGDPAKMKTWMDSQNYKPNWVTAKRFHTLRAEVNGKAYEDQQNDDWKDYLDLMTEMTQTQQLEYMSKTLPTLDPDSLVWKNMDAARIEVEGKVAAATRSTQMSLKGLEMKSTNMGIVAQWKDKFGFTGLDHPNTQRVLTARALGVVDIDPVTGGVSFGKTVYDPNSIPADVMLQIDSAIGETVPLFGADYVAQAFEAAKLPADSSSAFSAADAFNVAGKVVTASGSTNPIEGILAAVSSIPKDRPDRALSLMDSAVESIGAAGVDGRTSADAIRRLDAVEATLDWETSRGTWEQYGLTEESFNASTSKLRERINRERNSLSVKVVGASEQQFQEAVKSASSMAEVNVAAQASMMTVVETFASTDMDASMIGYTSFSPTGGFALTRVDASTDMSDPSLKGFIPLGYEIVSSEVGAVPFLTAARGGEGFVYVGSGAAGARKIQSELDQGNKMLKTLTAIGYADRMKEGKYEGLGPAEIHQGSAQILRSRNPLALADMIVRNPTAYSIVPSDKESTELLRTAFSESRLLTAPQAVRKQINIAAAKDETFLSAVQGGFADPLRGEVMIRYSGHYPDEGLYAAVTQKVAEMKTPTFNVYKGKIEDVRDRLYQWNTNTTNADFGMAYWTKLEEETALSPGTEKTAEYNLWMGMQEAYTKATGRELKADMQSDAEYPMGWVNAYLNSAERAFARSNNPQAWADDLSAGNVHVNYMPRDPDNAFSENGQVTTAAQVGGHLIGSMRESISARNLTDEQKQDQELGLARTFLGSDAKLEDLEPLQRFLSGDRTGLSENQIRRFTAAEKLISGMYTAKPIPQGEDNPVFVDQQSPRTQYGYSISVNPEILDLSALPDAMRTLLFDTWRPFTINRFGYQNAPAGYQTGSAINASRAAALVKPVLTPEERDDVAHGRVRPRGVSGRSIVK